MFDDVDEILAQLRAGEDSLSEFKEVRIDRHGKFALKADAIAGEMVAFANAEGGCIFLGVDDHGLARGIARERKDDLILWIVSVARDSCDPPIDPTIRAVDVPGYEGDDVVLVLVKVRRGLYVHRTKSGRYYKRVGTAKSDLSPVELGRLMHDRTGWFLFDQQTVPDATLDDLDSPLLGSHFDLHEGIAPLEIFRNTRVVREVDGVLRPTVGGLLAFGLRPSDQLPPAYISVAVYGGIELTSDALADADEIHGPVSYQIDSAVAFVARHMKSPARKSLGRMDYPQYDLEAIFEAVVNAVVHRDYSILGSKIRIFLYDDRLEIYSPGRLPNSMRVKELEFRVVTRNQLLAQFLSRIKSRRTGRFYLESRGEGVRKIIRSSMKLSGRRPEYELFGEELRLTIWAQSAPR